jgi:hypothetical protein
MNDDAQVLETMWGNIREKLYDLMVTGGMRKGNFNYDSEMGRYQLKDTKLKNCKVSNIEFIKCELEGAIDNSWFFDCDIKHSRIHDCDSVKNNKIYFSKVVETKLHTSTMCEDCYIENKKQIINCEVVSGVIRSGEIGKLARISKETLIVEGPPVEEYDYTDEEQDADNKKKSKEKDKKK